MEIERGQIFWVNFSPSTGSELADLHPALVVQSTHICQTNINTVVVVGITSNMRLAAIRGNVVLKKAETKLQKDSVVNVSQIFTIDKSRLENCIDQVSDEKLEAVYEGLDMLFGRFL